MKVKNGFLAFFLVGLMGINACNSTSSIPLAQKTATFTPEPTVTPTIAPSPTSTPLPRKQGLIAFYTNLSKMGGGIYVISADGNGEPIMLSAHPSNDSKPTWSPDGSKIAFESIRDDVANQKYMDIYIMNSDGSQLTRLTNTDCLYR